MRDYHYIYYRGKAPIIAAQSEEASLARVCGIEQDALPFLAVIGAELIEALFVLGAENTFTQKAVNVLNKKPLIHFPKNTSEATATTSTSMELLISLNPKKYGCFVDSRNNVRVMLADTTDEITLNYGITMPGSVRIEKTEPHAEVILDLPVNLWDKNLYGEKVGVALWVALSDEPGLMDRLRVYDTLRVEGLLKSIQDRENEMDK